VLSVLRLADSDYSFDIFKLFLTLFMVPDLPLCLGVLKHRVPLASGRGWRGGGHLPAKLFFTMDFCLCGAILNLKAFCFGAFPHTMM
jgi:hypothetical protein